MKALISRVLLGGLGSTPANSHKPLVKIATKMRFMLCPVGFGYLLLYQEISLDRDDSAHVHSKAPYTSLHLNFWEDSACNEKTPSRQNGFFALFLWEFNKS